MTFLPIVERELRVVARLPATYRNRVLIVGAVTGVALIMLFVGFFSNSPSQIGRSMFWTLSYMAVAFCIVEGARKTADCVSEEKREGTLGLLFLTDLKGYDVILGKLTAKSSNSVYGLISVLPVLALSLILGGITVGQYWREVLALLNLLFFSLCAGLWVSCWCRDEQQAMASAFFFVAACIAIPLFMHASAFLPFSPVYAVHVADHQRYLTNPERYWASVGLVQVFSWGLLLWASLAVPGCWREKPPASPRKKWFQFAFSKDAEARTRRRARLLEINPMLWLAARDLKTASAWLFTVVFSVGAAAFGFYLTRTLHSGWVFPYVVCCWAINFVIKMRVAARATHCMAEARRNNALEMLLVTPLTGEEIIHGQFLALQRLFLKPIVIMLLIETAGLVIGSNQLSNGDGFVDRGFLALTVGYLLLNVLDIYAVAWAGMWHGLTCKTEGRAITKTIWLVLIVPMLCTFFTCGYGILFGIGLPIIFLGTARQRLRAELRQRAAMAYQPPAHAEKSAGLLVVDELQPLP